jgi:hypothetical protein
MICFKNTTTVGGDPSAQSKLKDLTDLTRRLFVAVYKERGWRSPFTELEVEFMQLTGQSPTLDEPLESSKSKLPRTNTKTPMPPVKPLPQEACKFYPKEEETCICGAGSDISGGHDICTAEYSKTCQWAAEVKELTFCGDAKVSEKCADCSANDYKPQCSFVGRKI